MPLPELIKNSPIALPAGRIMHGDEEDLPAYWLKCLPNRGARTMGTATGRGSRLRRNRRSTRTSSLTM
ncbi:hypothetical protein [Kibdelosporangium philippinense]|uniref:hypothetical protein n=1 Tax=Kibdelosporangium philippinense TaxID=211113 RepID=UPI0036219D41